MKKLFPDLKKESQTLAVPKDTELAVRETELRKDVKSKKRYAEILSVFAKHNFYVNGFTPEELRTTLEDMGPTYVKIGQIMSSRTDILPESFCKELARLRSSVKPMEVSQVKSVIQQETGKSVEELYAEFRDEPLGSASIAQAHYGVLKDGTRVVTKVQRPEVADQMRRDFVMLRKLASLIGAASEEDASGTPVDLKSVIREMEKVTEEELDFRVEAENTRYFREHCIEDPQKVSCPVIIDELTTERILTMTYVDGFSISKKEKVEACGCDRTQIGEALLENYLHQVLDVGTFHADPHQGNIMISNGVPYWIDFGMVGHISEQSAASLQAVVLALLQKDAEALTDAALAIGKQNGKLDKGKLIEDVEALISRYSSGRLEDLDTGALMTDLTQLMSTYNISMPGEYTMLVRSLVTIEGVLEEFCPEINLFDFLMQKLIQKAKENFDIQGKLQELVESVSVMGVKSARFPSVLFDVLKNLSKGRLKIKFELSGGDELFRTVNVVAKNIVLSIFSCVLFLGSCLICLADVEPKIAGLPWLAYVGFAFSVSLAIYAVESFSKKSTK